MLVRVDRDQAAVVVRLMLTFDRAATDFLGDCERRGFTPKSLADYDRAYRHFAATLPLDTDVSKVTTDDIMRFLNTKAHLARGTRHQVESALSSLFKWLLKQRKIAANPMDGITRTRQLPPDELDVVTVSTKEVKLMLEAASGWTERLCLGVLVYTGCRRRAAAGLRLTDYDELHKRLRFREKGGKIIWKPVPHELDDLIRSAIAAGVYAEQDYLIPNKQDGRLARSDRRDDRFIWRTVKDVAARVGVKCHTHALRAAFIVYYLETHPGDQLGAQLLAGHRSPATTQIYQRKLDKTKEMERVRDLSWGVSVGQDQAGANTQAASSPEAGASSGMGSEALRNLGASPDNAAASRSPQIADKRLDEEAGVGAGGFEPPEAEDPLQQRVLTEHLTDALHERLNQAVGQDTESRALALEDVQTTEGKAT